MFNDFEEVRKFIYYVFFFFLMLKQYTCSQSQYFILKNEKNQNLANDRLENGLTI